MTKAELIDVIAEKAEVTKKDAGAMIAAFCEAITGAEKTTLVGFGTFTYKTRAARTGRNPQTGKAIQIAESRALTFKAAKKH